MKHHTSAPVRLIVTLLTLCILGGSSAYRQGSKVIRDASTSHLTTSVSLAREALGEAMAYQARQLALLQKQPRVRRAQLAARGGRDRARWTGSLAPGLSAADLTALRLRQLPAGVPCLGEMTSPFGVRIHPIYGYGRQHNGCDFTAGVGTEIVATGGGTVKTAGWLGGYGKAVEIDHGFGLITLYAHCSTLEVQKGQRVERGQRIATVGMTGLASGPHCHYEVHKNGVAVDPQAYFRELSPSVGLLSTAEVQRQARVISQKWQRQLVLLQHLRVFLPH